MTTSIDNNVPSQMAGENVKLANSNSQLIMDEEPFTPIQKFYDNCNIFITGGTGFLGKSTYTNGQCRTDYNKYDVRAHAHTHRIISTVILVNLFTLSIFVDQIYLYIVFIVIGFFLYCSSLFGSPCSYCYCYYIYTTWNSRCLSYTHSVCLFVIYGYILSFSLFLVGVLLVSAPS